ncbi:MAG: hypothetical protein OXL96_09200 [Candidatus Poribacteria bacterium]|nr:hypothetical protein [Candidatus Poribacteria bacterium]
MNNQQLQSTSADAELMAEQDAESNTKTVRWFFIGFLGGILGILIASVYEPSPPHSRLLGKPPEYIILYTNRYKAKSQRTQVLESIGGFVVIIILAILWFWRFHLLSLFGW